MIFWFCVFSRRIYVKTIRASRKKAHPVRLLQRFKHKKFRGRSSFASLFNVEKGEPPIRRASPAPWGGDIISRSLGFRVPGVGSPCAPTPRRFLHRGVLSQTLSFFFCIRFRAKSFFGRIRRSRTTTRKYCRGGRHRRQLWFCSRRVGRDTSHDSDKRRASSGHGA